MHRKRPCRICRCWFRPDPRVGERQRVCFDPGCQKENRRRKQAEWRERHPGYFRTWRLRKRSNQAHAARETKVRPSNGEPRDPVKQPSTLRVPRELREVPWELAKSEIGVENTDLIAVIATLLLGVAKSKRCLQCFDNKRDTGPLGGGVAKS